MLTSFQVSTGAYVDEYGSLYCEPCFEAGGIFAQPVSNYQLDEWQSEQSGRDYYYDQEGHSEDDCYCSPALSCESCYGEIREEFVSPECEELQGEAQ